VAWVVETVEELRL